MLRVSEISVAFGARTVLDRVSIGIDAGEVVALQGPSGSGKSTLLRVIAGIAAPDTGIVEIDGVDVTEVPTHRRSVGMVFQDDQLFPHLDVGRNVEFGLRMTGTPSTQRQHRVAEVLALVGLGGFERRSVDRLSGGESKRVALARSLAPSPKVLLLDEPLTGLDAELQQRLGHDLARVLRETTTTSLWVTHDRAEAAAAADRVLTLDELAAG